MRLLDLDAEFLGNVTKEGYQRLDSIDGAQGIIFQCPKCAQGKERGMRENTRNFIIGCHYILCWFTNPRNANLVPQDMHPLPGRWTIVSGNSLVDLSLQASIQVTSGCMWHGYVTDGIATTI